MPQRLRQTTAQDGHPLIVNNASVVGAHEQLASIVKARLGRAHAELLATPDIGGSGSITWSTALGGPVTAATALDTATRSALQAQSARMLGDIAGLGKEMAGGAPSTQLVGQMLERAVRTPPGEWLYSVGGKPVLVMWGHSAAAEPGYRAPPPPPPAPAPIAAPLRGDPLTGAGAGTDIAEVSERPSRRAPLLLIGVLVALLLALLALSKSMAPPATDMSAEIADTDARNKVLEDEIRKRKAGEQRFACVMDQPAPLPPPVAASEPPAPPPPQAASTPKTAEQKIAEARDQCPGERPPELAPEMVVVFDASGSMNFGIGTTDEQINALSVMQQLAITPFLQQRAAAMEAQLSAEPRRITAARQAALTAVKSAPSDANIGLVVLDKCYVARSFGFHSPAQRPSLLQRIQAIEPNEGTPLADAVQKAGAMLDGVKRDSLMVVVSDGVEGCNGNPCAVAAALAKSKPHLKINVVDITGAGAGTCLANATHGKVFTARNAAEVAQGMSKAVADAQGPARCRKS